MIYIYIKKKKKKKKKIANNEIKIFKYIIKYFFFFLLLYIRNENQFILKYKNIIVCSKFRMWIVIFLYFYF